jgi:hypothetical protein
VRGVACVSAGDSSETTIMSWKEEHMHQFIILAADSYVADRAWESGRLIIVEAADDALSI